MRTSCGKKSPTEHLGKRSFPGSRSTRKPLHRPHAKILVRVSSAKVFQILSDL